METLPSVCLTATIATDEARAIPANTALTMRTSSSVSLAAPRMISGMWLERIDPLIGIAKTQLAQVGRAEASFGDRLWLIHRDDDRLVRQTERRPSHDEVLTRSELTPLYALAAVENRIAGLAQADNVQPSLAPANLHVLPGNLVIPRDRPHTCFAAENDPVIGRHLAAQRCCGCGP